jgi:hypothetical protein
MPSLVRPQLNSLQHIAWHHIDRYGPVICKGKLRQPVTGAEIGKIDANTMKRLPFHQSLIAVSSTRTRTWHIFW